MAVHVNVGTPHDVTLVEPTLVARVVAESPAYQIGDKADEGDPTDERLAERGIELIVRQRPNRKQAKTQQGQRLRRDQQCWRVERLIASLQHFRLIVVRYADEPGHYLGFVHLGCRVILLRWPFCDDYW
jgi:transposase